MKMSKPRRGYEPEFEHVGETRDEVRTPETFEYLGAYECRAWDE